jgi:DNA-binding transcriptional LysR family regulator
MPGVAVPETGGLERRQLLVDDLYAVLPEGHRLARRDAVSVADLEAEPLILPRRETPAGRFRSMVEHLCAQAGFAPQVAYELDDLPAVQAFVAAGIGVVPMHGLTLATVPLGATIRPLAERPAGSRTVEALAPVAPRTPVVDDLLERLAHAASAYALTRQAGARSAR